MDPKVHIYVASKQIKNSGWLNQRVYLSSGATCSERAAISEFIDRILSKAILDKVLPDGDFGRSVLQQRCELNVHELHYDSKNTGSILKFV